MKIRSGFISNSSSSSFIINYCDTTSITMEQLRKILNYPSHIYLKWNFDDKNGAIIGTTTGDDGQMKQYLEDIGVDEALIMWKYN